MNWHAAKQISSGLCANALTGEVRLNTSPFLACVRYRTDQAAYLH